MYPAHPPLPTASNLPFHLFAGGNQSSILMSESDEGFRTATTRQCSGAMIGAGGVAPARAGAGAGGAPVRGGGAGTGLNSPSGTNSALVMVVFGSETDFSPSQGVDAMVAAITAKVRVSITVLLLNWQLSGWTPRNYHTTCGIIDQGAAW